MGLPVDIRVREAIVALSAEGRTYKEIAALLGVGEATVSRTLRLHRENGSLEPRPRGGGNFSRIEGKVAELLRRIVEQMPDSTVDEITAALVRAARIPTSRSSVLRAMHRLGFTLKKRPSSRSNATRPNGRNTAASSANT